MSDWISVEDRLPSAENESWCLVFADGAVNCMMFYPDKFYDATYAKCHNIIVDEITHWMPLPSPPESK